MKKKQLQFRERIKIAWRLISHRRLPTMIITVILSAFSFGLMAIGLTGLTYSPVQYISRAYLRYNRQYSYTQFVANGDTERYSREWFTQSQIQQIQEMVDREVICTVPGFYWQYFVQDRTAAAGNDLYAMGYLPEASGISSSGLGAFGLSATDEGYRSLGFELLAGEYPDEEGEIAISEAHFQAFCNRGYVDAAVRYVWEDYVGDDATLLGQFVYDASIPAEESVSITEYSDLIGRSLGMGDPERDGEHAYSYTIVGIVDTHMDEAAEQELLDRSTPAARWLFSPHAQQEHGALSVFCSAITDGSTMRRCVREILALREETFEQGGFFPALADMRLLMREEDMADELAFAAVFGGAGAFLALFSILLNGYLSARMVGDQSKQIGILRSLGASRGIVRVIMWLGLALTATATLILAVALSLGVFYGWIFPETVNAQFGVSYLVYNGWTVLILAAFCYGVPLLCSLVPLQKFLNKTIVQNLTGSMEKPRKRKRRVRQ